MGVPFVGLVRNSSLNSTISFARETYFFCSRFAFLANSGDGFTSQFVDKFFERLKLFSPGDGFIDIMDRFL